MYNVAKREIACDQALDYLFQESIEERYESLMLIEGRSEESQRFVDRLSQWFRRGSCDIDPYEDYLKEE